MNKCLFSQTLINAHQSLKNSTADREKNLHYSECFTIIADKKKFQKHKDYVYF